MARVSDERLEAITGASLFNIPAQAESLDLALDLQDARRELAEAKARNAALVEAARHFDLGDCDCDECLRCRALMDGEE